MSTQPTQYEVALAALTRVYEGPWGLKASDLDAAQAVAEALGMQAGGPGLDAIAEEVHQLANQHGWDLPEMAAFLVAALGTPEQPEIAGVDAAVAAIAAALVAAGLTCDLEATGRDVDDLYITVGDPKSDWSLTLDVVGGEADGWVL